MNWDGNITIAWKIIHWFKAVMNSYLFTNSRWLNRGGIGGLVFVFVLIVQNSFFTAETIHHTEYKACEHTYIDYNCQHEHPKGHVISKGGTGLHLVLEYNILETIGASIL
jgi:hypothetical protein